MGLNVTYSSPDFVGGGGGKRRERGEERGREREEVITAEDKIVWPFLNLRNAFEARERHRGGGGGRGGGTGGSRR